MNIQLPNMIVDPEQYESIVSLGNKCLSRIALDDLQLSKKSYPFDWVPTQPYMIFKYLMNSASFLPKKPNEIYNDDKVWFGHFDLSPEGRVELEEKFRRRFDRLFELFGSGKKFLFLYTTESDVYNEMQSLINKPINYIHLKLLVNHIHQMFPNANFDMLCIHTNDERPHEQIGGTTIYNFTVYVDKSCLSMNMETHVDAVITPYRDVVKFYLKCIFWGMKEEFYKDLEDCPLIDRYSLRMN